MSRKSIDIPIPTQRVQIGDRIFTLREMSAQDIQEYSVLHSAYVDAVVVACGGPVPDKVAAAHQAAIELVQFVLGSTWKDADGKEHDSDAAWLRETFLDGARDRKVSRRLLDDLLDAQQDLNSPATLGNFLCLLPVDPQ